MYARAKTFSSLAFVYSLATGLFLISAVAAFAASITSFTANPNPALVGNTITLSVTTDNSPPPSGFAWSYTCGDSGCAHDAVPITGAGANAYFIAPYIGNHIFACTATFTMPGMPPTSLSATGGGSADVQGPDNDNLASGPGIDATWNSGIPVEFDFVMQKGAIPIGTLAAGTIQERIERPQSLQDSGWIDGAPGILYKQGATIIDMKKATFDSAFFFSTGVNGGVLDDFYQTNRFLGQNCCGQTVTCTFPRRHFRRVRSGLNTFNIVQIFP